MTFKDRLKQEIAVLESMMWLTPLLSSQLNLMRALLKTYEAALNDSRVQGVSRG